MKSVKKKGRSGVRLRNKWRERVNKLGGNITKEMRVLGQYVSVCDYGSWGRGGEGWRADILMFSDVSEKDVCWSCFSPQKLWLVLMFLTFARW